MHAQSSEQQVLRERKEGTGINQLCMMSAQPIKFPQYNIRVSNFRTGFIFWVIFDRNAFVRWLLKIVLAKKFIWVLHNILLKNLNKLFSQPNE